MQAVAEEAEKYSALPPEKLLEAAQLTSKRSLTSAERAAIKAAKQQRDRQIDDNAKLAREAAAAAAKMAAALAEPADIGRYNGRRRKRSVPAAKKAEKVQSVVPDWDVDNENITQATDAHPSACTVKTPVPVEGEEQTSAGVCSEPFSALPGPTPVLVDGSVEWVVKMISERAFVRERGRIIPKWKVHWEGGEVTWEKFNVVKNCAALDVFERKRKRARVE